MDKLYIATFCAIILLPILLKPLNLTQKLKSNENKSLATLPTQVFPNILKSNGPKQNAIALHRDLARFTENYEAYFQDNYLFKPVFFSANVKLQNSVFNAQALPQEVIDGTDGWMFLGDSYSNVVMESKGIKQFSEDELLHIKNAIIKRKQWFEEKGIHYYLAVAPNKHTIYGNKIPILHSGRKTKLQQLKDALTDSRPLIDLGMHLNSNSKLLLYHKTDSHWNDLGAFIASSSLISKIQKDVPELRLLTLEDYEITREKDKVLDLAKLLNRHTREDRVLLTKKTDEDSHPGILRYPGVDENRFVSDVNDVKVLIYGDSFCIALKKYLKESFGETLILWGHHFDYSYVEKEQAHVFIQEIAERDLDLLLLESY